MGGTLARTARPLPSYGVAAIGGLSLLCLALSVALAAALSTPTGAAGHSDGAVESAVGQSAGGEADGEAASEAAAPPSPAAFAAAPRPIPVELLTGLEAAGERPVATELNALLGALQHGFGTESARLEPTIGSYAARTAARLALAADTFRVAVTAPSADLAEARAALVSRLFAEGGGHVRVAAGIGPHALTLVSD